MKIFKSNKQRRLEIRAARERRRSARVETARGPAVDLRPPGTAPVDAARLRTNSYGAPDFVMRGYYQDLPFRCVDCGAQCLWKAERQKWWYEVAAGDVYTTARRCAACREKERLRKALARQAWQDGLLRKLARRGAEAAVPRETE